MAYKRITAAEAASMIRNGENIGLSGFTPAGTAKAVTKELAKIAQAEHEAGREFKVGLFTGASTGQSADGDLPYATAPPTPQTATSAAMSTPARLLTTTST